MLATSRNQVSLFWNKQSKPQQVTILVLVLAALIIVPTLLFWASRPSYSVAYSGLSEADAGQIVQKLDDSKIPYTLKDTGTILVPSGQVYQVRLMLARDGLPQSSTVGYELLDGNMLGMTDFLQRVNYQRALEGELEKTIGTLSTVQMVRVHIVTPEKTLLSDNQDPTTASVTIKEKQGQSLDAAQVRSISHLVASSVEGLKPENVVVVDAEGNLLSAIPGDDTAAMASQSDDQRAAEVAAAVEIKKRVQNMLDKVLGPNRYVTQASVQMDWSQHEVTSSVFDPTPAAVRSSHTIEEAYNTDGTALGGVPGAATNLPTPLPNVTATGEPAYYQRVEKTYNYEISQTETKETIPAGQIKQISLSIMVDQVNDPAQLASIKSAAAAAAGINPDRGDQIVIESLGFDRSYYEAQASELDQQQIQDRTNQMYIAGAAGLLLLILLVYFLTVFRRLRHKSAENWRPIMRPVSELALQQGGGMLLPDAISMELPTRDLSQAFSSAAQKTDEEMMAEINNNHSSAQTFPEDEQKSRVIQRLTEEDPATVAEIIQIWLNEDEKRNG